MYCLRNGQLQVLLAHPGGPFYRNKDNGFWTIPKGEIAPDENGLDAAVREFTEETGIIPGSEFIPLGWVKQKSGKTIHAWTFEYFGDEDIKIISNEFELEWPPNSGSKQFIPEIDDGRFFPIDEARIKIKKAQVQFLDVLQDKLIAK